MAVTLNTFRDARRRIAPYILGTPLLRLPALDSPLGCKVYVKAECLQITGAFKLRGAMNKLLSLPAEQLARGVCAASSGNHGRALAYGAKQLGTSAVIVIPRTAPEIKIEGIRALGAEVVLSDADARFAVAETISQERGMTIVPPYDDEAIMAGQGTLGLEIMEECPEMDMVITPVSGGGLLSGTAAAVKGVSPRTRVFGAEPDALPRYSESLAVGRRVTVERHESVADALVSVTPGEHCFPCVQQYADGVAPVSDEYLLKGMRLLLTEGKLLGEPSACTGLGAVLQKRIAVKPDERVCFVISGGNTSLAQVNALTKIN